MNISTQRKLMPLLVVAMTAGLTAAAIEFLPHTVFFPLVALSAPGGLQVTFLQPGRAERADCEKIVAEIAQAHRASCAECKVNFQCTQGLSADQRSVLSREPIAMPSARMAGGALTITFSAADANLALAACRQSEQQSAAQAASANLRCFPAGVAR
jgi:hypothetical protein